MYGQFEPTYRLRRYVCSVVLMAPRSGVWRNPGVFDAVDELPTFHMKHFYFGGGDVVPEATSLGSMVGWVVLAGQDHDAMMADYRHIKELETHMVVEPRA